MTDPTTRPAPDEILEMVREFGRTREELGKSYEGETRNTINGLQRSCDEQLSKIAAALATYGWRPIADAPKDGTEVLVRSLFGYVDILSWVSDLGWTDRDGDPALWAKTHFQHLPAPPAPPKEG